MKKLLLMVSAIIVVLTSCEKDSSEPNNYEDGFKYLSGLNVSDAKMIYQKESSSSTRADADGGYWKIDLSGKESKLVIKGEDGQNHNISIDEVRKLNDRILVIRPNVHEISYLIGAVGYGGDNKDEPYIMVSEEYYTSFVDVKTEKIYKCPSEFTSLGYINSNIQIESDIKGNVYFKSHDNKLYKLDILNFAIQQMLPEGLQFDIFRVTGDGFIAYWNINDYNYKVKCPEGRIVPIIGKGFVWNDNVYSIDNGKIYLWSPVGMNNLEKKEICSDTFGLSSRDYLINDVRNTIVFKTSNGKYVEFNGAKVFEEFSLSDNFNPYNSNEIYLSSKAWYRNDNGKLHKLDMQTYQEKEIPMLDYEIQKLYGDTGKADLTFEGFRYSDGVSVIGTIKATDEVVIDKFSENGNKIINLIPLN